VDIFDRIRISKKKGLSPDFEVLHLVPIVYKNTDIQYNFVESGITVHSHRDPQ